MCAGCNDTIMENILSLAAQGYVLEAGIRIYRDSVIQRLFLESEGDEDTAKVLGEAYTLLNMISRVGAAMIETRDENPEGYASTVKVHALRRIAASN